MENALEGSGRTSISVRVNGIGIDKEDLPIAPAFQFAGAYFPFSPGSTTLLPLGKENTADIQYEKTSGFLPNTGKNVPAFERNACRIKSLPLPGVSPPASNT